MTLDMDRLREALDLFDLVDWADEDDTPEEWRDVYLQLGAAARVLLTGEKRWYCTSHFNLGDEDYCTDLVTVQRSCRMVEGLLIFPEGSGE